MQLEELRKQGHGMIFNGKYTVVRKNTEMRKRYVRQENRSRTDGDWMIIG